MKLPILALTLIGATAVTGQTQEAVAFADDDLAEDLKVLQGKWQLVGNRIPGQSSVRTVIGDQQELIQFDVKTGETVQRIAGTIVLGKFGSGRVFRMADQKDGDGFIYHLDGDDLFEIAGILTPHELGPQVWRWKRVRDRDAVVVAAKVDENKPVIVAPEFTSKRAKEAQERYNAASSRARDTLIAALETARRAAKRARDDAEAERIAVNLEELKKAAAEASTVDAIAAFRVALEGVKFTWNRTSGDDRALFGPDGEFIIERRPNGHWQVLRPFVVIIKFSDSVYLLEFDKAVNSYRPTAYTYQRTNLKDGTRLP